VSVGDELGQTLPPSQRFIIPEPPSFTEDTTAKVESLTQALEEQKGNETGTLEDRARRGRLEWNLRFVLKILLFTFVIALNVWWDTRVADWVWFSGYAKGNFKLSDGVLIALVSTSTANFLALILIVAKHLFPSDK
jgi:hypothetical protein